MLKALIIDDEIPAQKVLQQLVSDHCPEVTVEGLAGSASEARKFLSENDIDILFLDINMPKENGFDFLHTLSSSDYSVIFVTGNQEYALQALKASAVDFLLKPVDIDELKDAVIKADTFLQLRRKNKSLNAQYIDTVSHLSENLNLQLPISRLTLHHLQGFKIISIADIIYLEADGNYTVFYMLNSEKIVVSRQMGEYEELLDKYYFFRTHKSFIVNFRYLKEYSSVDGYFAIMKGDISVIISRRKVEEFMQMVKKFSLLN